jgi:hypothetical protein
MLYKLVTVFLLAYSSLSCGTPILDEDLSLLESRAIRGTKYIFSL